MSTLIEIPAVRNIASQYYAAMAEIGGLIEKGFDNTCAIGKEKINLKLQFGSSKCIKSV